MNLFLYLLLCLIWGTTWLVIKVGYGGLGPFNVAAIRFFVAGGVVALLVLVLRVAWPSGRREWGVVAVIGLAMFAADYGLIYWAEQFVDSGLTATLFAVMPIITIVLAHFFVPGDCLTSRKIFGTLLAFGGIVALFGEHVRLDPAAAWPMAAIVVAALCASIASIVSKKHGASLHPAALNAPAMLIGAFFLAGASLLSGDGLHLPGQATTWGAIVYPGDRRQRNQLPRVLYAAEDVERHQSRVHQHLHAGDCPVARLWPAERTPDAADGGGRRADPRGRDTDVHDSR